MSTTIEVTTSVITSTVITIIRVTIRVIAIIRTNQYKRYIYKDNLIHLSMYGLLVVEDVVVIVVVVILEIVAFEPIELFNDKIYLFNI